MEEVEADANKESLGELLRSYCKAARLTQAKLANFVGVYRMRLVAMMSVRPLF